MKTLHDTTPARITLALVIRNGSEHRAPVLSTGATDGAIALIDSELVRVERWDDDRYTVPPAGIPLTPGTARASTSADVYTALCAFAALQDLREAELDDDGADQRTMLF